MRNCVPAVILNVWQPPRVASMASISPSCLPEFQLLQIPHDSAQWGLLTRMTNWSYGSEAYPKKLESSATNRRMLSGKEGFKQLQLRFRTVWCSSWASQFFWLDLLSFLPFYCRGHSLGCSNPWSHCCFKPRRWSFMSNLNDNLRRVSWFHRPFPFLLIVAALDFRFPIAAGAVEAQASFAILVTLAASHFVVEKYLWI